MEAESIIDPENIRKNTFRIGDFRIEPTRNLVIKDELRQSLEPLIMDVLCELASYPGQVIGRFELIKRIWKVDYGADESLTRAISILRKTFRNGGVKSKYIETISKNGYRLIAPVAPWTKTPLPKKSSPPVSPQTTAFPKADLALSNISARIEPISETAAPTEIAAAPAPNSIALPAEPTSPQPKRNFVPLFIASIVAVAVIGLSAQAWRNTVGDRSDPGNESGNVNAQALDTINDGEVSIVDGQFVTDPNRYGRSVAVLSFTDMSAESDQQYFADGMAEEILDELSAISSLRVVGRNASFAYKDKDVNLREIGDDLKVSHVIDGSIRTQNDRVRISAQLVNTGDLTQVWSRSYDGNLKDGLALQDQISRDIVAELILVMSLGIETFDIDISNAAAPIETEASDP